MTAMMSQSYQTIKETDILCYAPHCSAGPTLACLVAAQHVHACQVLNRSEAGDNRAQAAELAGPQRQCGGAHNLDGNGDAGHQEHHREAEGLPEAL